MSNPLIPAATILLLRDLPQFEVLMVERHAAIEFAGGALVFPGGRIEGGDHDVRWADHCDGFDSVPQDERGPRIAAIREAFEETGLLLARRDGAMAEEQLSGKLSPWRKKVEANDRLFLDIIAGEGLLLAADALTLFARWRPPAGVAHRRYDTWFFAAKAPKGQRAKEDGNEATEIVWSAPAEAIADAQAGRRRMIFPTRRNVELLGQSDSADAALQFACRRDRSPIEPAIKESSGKRYLSIPEGRGYPVTEEPLESVIRS